MMSAGRVARKGAQEGCVRLTDVQPPVECPGTVPNPCPFPLGMVLLVYRSSCGDGWAPGVKTGGQNCGRGRCGAPRGAWEDRRGAVLLRSLQEGIRSVLPTEK
ncbi:hypothetical protein SKAU_G00014370 [Synaphobranchus kaupii]|uniref:Uncharacterized protein n=1 Tax=Synaphobranchus kaupii TaxID=118154 RepID=A0A9Q1GAN3_SYNKA|nr:hypothetical protein SKAU_G00014370 [Synaphobranchus kaupii]